MEGTGSNRQDGGKVTIVEESKPQRQRLGELYTPNSTQESLRKQLAMETTEEGCNELGDDCGRPDDETLDHKESKTPKVDEVKHTVHQRHGRRRNNCRRHVRCNTGEPVNERSQ